MELIERIAWNGQPLCYIVKAEMNPEQTTFLTPSEFNIQVGYIVYPTGYEISRHLHRPIRRSLVGTSEVLLVRKGCCEIDVYNDDRQLIATRVLRRGDIMIMVGGGHGFRMLENSVLLEVKQGPYPGVEEKERF